MPTLPKSSIPPSSRRGRGGALLVAVGLMLILLAVFSVCAGSVSIALGELWRVIWSGEIQSKAGRILWLVRIPRTLAAILAGCGLSLCGAILQTVLDNPLASPSTIGVNAGSGLFTITLAALLPGSVALSPLAAFLGALFAVFLVYGIARKTGASRMAIVLSGVAVSSFLGAVTDTVLTLVPNTQMSRIEFLIGSFSGVTMQNIRMAGPAILLGAVLALALGYDMNVLSLGEETAATLGLRVRTLRTALLVVCALLAGCAISFSGLIGFVGLIVPHLGRMLVGQDNRTLLPLSALLGGAFTLGCDILARLLFAPFELPVGVVMSFLGGPFFIYLLLSRRGVQSV